MCQSWFYLLPFFLLASPLSRPWPRSHHRKWRSHHLELRNEILQSERLARGLRGARFERDMHDVDVEMVVCGLICFRDSS